MQGYIDPSVAFECVPWRKRGELFMVVWMVLKLASEPRSLERLKRFEHVRKEYCIEFNYSI